MDMVKDTLFETSLVEKLCDLKYKIATAESCTGGMIASKIVNVPGASNVLDVSFVTYANAAKEKYLGVSSEIIDQYSVVSKEVAKAMAEGLRRETGCDVAIATTGIAGPDGGDDINTVGTVFIAVAIDNKTIVERYVFDGDREEVRVNASNKAIEMAYNLI